MLFLASNMRQMGHLARGVYGGPFGGHATLGTGIVAYWKFDGDATDELGNYNGTTINSPSYATGKIGKGIDLEASSTQSVQVYDGRIRDDTAGSLSMWFKAETASNVTMFTYGGGAESNASTFTLDIISSGNATLNNKIRFATRNSADGNTINWYYSSDAVTASTWYFVVVTSDGSTITVYVNGSEDTNLYSGSNNGDWIGDVVAAETDKTFIGLHQYNGTTIRPFDGIIDEVGLWSRELTQAEVRALYNSGSGLSY